MGSRSKVECRGFSIWLLPTNGSFSLCFDGRREGPAVSLQSVSHNNDFNGTVRENLFILVVLFACFNWLAF